MGGTLGYWCGQRFCKPCGQVVDVYSEDNIRFECGFCGEQFTNDSLNVKNPPSKLAECYKWLCDCGRVWLTPTERPPTQWMSHDCEITSGGKK